jgi:release factor glutamine methyltransferase
MKNAKILLMEIVRSVLVAETPGEIESIAFVLLEDLFGVDRNMVMSDKVISWNEQDQHKLESALERINQGEPVQYVVGTALFYGRRFFVDKSVLIPRPETEELAEFVIGYIRTTHPHDGVRILDIGTGSGCLPVTFAAEIKGSTIMATDISEAAIATASRNVRQNRVQVQLLLHDVLTQPLPFTDVDVITSNPPYIPRGEKEALSRHVVDHEPHLALFVEDEDPLLFYRAIARKSKSAFSGVGLLAVETHAGYAADVAELFTGSGYQHVGIRPDLSGNARIVHGTWASNQ